MRPSAMPASRLTPKRLMISAALVVAVVLAGFSVAVVGHFIDKSTPQYRQPIDHYKYGSIGTEPAGGLPYWIWKALPVLFKDQLGAEGFEKFGMIYETVDGHKRDLPVGVATRKYRGLDMVWINCAFCHAGTYRTSANDPRHLLPGMPANNLDMHGFIRFLLEAAVDERFTPTYLLPAIEEAGGKLGWFDRLYYEMAVIPTVRDGLLLRRARFLPILQAQPLGGPGRVDSFNILKTVGLGIRKADMPPDEWIGTNDFPSVFLQRWRLKPEQGAAPMSAHWDGNNSSLAERNLSAATGAGATPEHIDHDAIRRATDLLLDLAPPESPYQNGIDAEAAKRGQVIYMSDCRACHGWMEGRRFRFDGERLGYVDVPVSEMGTDRGRFDAFSEAVVAKQHELFKGTEFEFRHFHKTIGYSNLPLDGLWTRAPYLHNGSVPNLWSLLKPPAERPVAFRRGSDILDPVNGGFEAPPCDPEKDSPGAFCYDTRKPGNSNAGHNFGTGRSVEERRDLLEYLKTF
jgi:hypothetical protein